MARQSLLIGSFKSHNQALYRKISKALELDNREFRSCCHQFLAGYLGKLFMLQGVVGTSYNTAMIPSLYNEPPPFSVGMNYEGRRDTPLIRVCPMSLLALRKLVNFKKGWT